MLSSIMALVVAAFISHAQPQAIQQNAHLSVLQTECLTEAVYFESRGEGIFGGAAVSYVIQNRAIVEHKSFCQIIHEKGQFSFYRPGQALVIKESDAWNRSVQIAVDTQLGIIHNPIGNATYYNTTPFYGVRHIVLVARVGHHLFYGPPKIVYGEPLISSNPQLLMVSYQPYTNVSDASPILHVQTKNQDVLAHNNDRVKTNYESNRFRHRYKKIIHHRKESRLPHFKSKVKRVSSMRSGRS